MTRVRGLAGLAAVSTVLLTGCGAVPDVSPGVAARVGDESVSVERVSDVSDDYCAAIQQLEPQVIPNTYLNQTVAGSLALRSAADQLLAANDVELDGSYDAAVEQAKQQFADLSGARLDAFIEVAGAQTYAAATAIAVGRAELGGSPTDEEALAAGQQELTSWIDDHDVEIDPRYGVNIDDGQVALEDSSLSFGLSDTAKQAGAEQPDTTYAAGLPSTQRCG